MAVPNASQLPWAKRIFFWQITLLPTYALLVLLLCFGAVLAASFESARLGPYTTWYNQHLRQKASGARLVGSSEQRVRAVLGEPDNVRQFWEVTGSDGQPAPGAQFVTTYEYYPYPFLPFSKFQVHCTQGVVRGLEMFDD